MTHRRVEIPEKQKLFLWARSAGRCQICNQPVYEDPLTFEEVNVGDHAHIIGSSPQGPRGDRKLSNELAKDPANLMLLCKIHHKKIDTPEFQKEYPVGRLREVKRMHEERVEFVTSIGNDNKSHVILYAANIGQQNNPVNFAEAARAMLPYRYPAEKNPIVIHIVGSTVTDDMGEYWLGERSNLRRKFETLIKDRIARGEITHLSVFALAPIPLLIELGVLLTDKTPVDVYQRLREPTSWNWQEETKDEFEYLMARPQIIEKKQAALVLSLSGTIPGSDVTAVLGEDVAIWSITIADVGNDFMRSKSQLRLFRQRFRKILNEIKASHGNGNVIHLFPAVPVSVAIEIGRVWMPKADLPVQIYDRNRSSPTFVKALALGDRIS